MPRLPLNIEIDDYLQIMDVAESRGVVPRVQIQHIWQLGLVAAGVRPEEARTDRQLVTIGASDGT